MPRGNGGIIGPVNTSFSGVWSLTEAQLRRSANTWPNFYAALLSESATGSDAVDGAYAADPYFEYTTLLLPGNGTNGAQNNTFLDGSTNNFTITRNGNTTQGTFSPFSQTGWGGSFSGSNQLTLPSALALAPEAGQFCIEFWIYPTASWGSVDRPIFVAAGAGGLWVGWQSTAFVLRAYGVANHLTYATAPTLNTWTHVAICRNSGNTTSMYFNGSRVATGTVTQNFAQAISYIGSDAAYGGGGAALLMASNLSNLRLVKGSSVYDPTQTSITVPTSPLTAVTNTTLLICQSNRFVDNSTANSGSGWAVTSNGNVTITPFSPFNPTASWSAATNGGSGYFDSSGDWLEVADNTALNLSGGVWTIEAWTYLTADYSNYRSIINKRQNGSSNAAYQLGTNITTGTLIFFNGTLFNTGVVLTRNTWNHVAAVYDGTNINVYLNGSRVLQSATGNTNYAANVRVGAFDSSEYWGGYITDVRILKGTAQYTGATYTVPTAPLTAITNTSLLLNFTNAGIYDATSKNDLETVGNAQISTTQSKWGGSSISFDGTGDWLLIPDQPPQRIGTGNFTVEMWVYRNSSGTYGLAGKGTGTTGWLVSLNSSNQVVFTYGSSTITSSGTVSATTWTHIAVVREGTSTNQTKIYISGTNDGTGTVSTDFNQTNSMYIGADRTGGSAANAYVQDVRITNYARYTANFTAPTAAFPTL